MHLVKSVWFTFNKGLFAFQLIRKLIYLKKKKKWHSHNKHEDSLSQKLFPDLSYVQHQLMNSSDKSDVDAGEGPSGGMAEAYVGVGNGAGCPSKLDNDGRSKY